MSSTRRRHSFNSKAAAPNKGDKEMQKDPIKSVDLQDDPNLDSLPDADSPDLSYAPDTDIAEDMADIAQITGGYGYAHYS